MTVDIDPLSGFCFGVVNAIKKAEEVLEREGSLYCLGDIVHNSEELSRLSQKGLIAITHDEFRKLRDVKVLLRAHGEPPSTYEIARRNNIEIIDATCPVVLKLQQRIKQAYQRDCPKTQIVIYGKRGHAEVNGLVGQTEGEAIVIENPDDLDKIDYSRPITLYSQTTKSPQGLNDIIGRINDRLGHSKGLFLHYDTICRQVAGRFDSLKQFALSYDLVIFVSGTKSSNGKVLYQECLNVNPNTRLIADPKEIDPSWLEGVGRVGICGATSTPRWLMERIAGQIKRISESGPDIT